MCQSGGRESSPFCPVRFSRQPCVSRPAGGAPEYREPGARASPALDEPAGPRFSVDHPHDVIILEVGPPVSQRCAGLLKPTGGRPRSDPRRQGAGARARGLSHASRPDRLARQLPQEPVLRELPVPHHGLGGDVQDFRRLLDAQATKETELNDLTLSLVLGRKRPQRVIDGNQVVRRVARDWQVLVERHTLEPTTALLILSRARSIHEHPPHEPSRHREKVRAILPPDATNINEPEVGLVDERRGLENVARTFASHLPLCQATQFVVHEREQLLQGSGVAVPPLDQQGCHVAQRSRGPTPARSRPATGASLEPPPLWVLRSDTARPFYAPP